MKKVTAYLLAMSVLIVLYGFQANQINDDVPAGEKIFIENKCATCHSVEAAGIILKKKKKTVPDLSDVGSKLEPAFIMKFITKQETLNDAKHMYGFKGSDEDLKTLVDWLVGLSKQNAMDSSATKCDSTVTKSDSTKINN